MEDEDADLLAAKLASIQEAQAAGIPILEEIDEEAKQIESDSALALSLMNEDDIPVPPPAPKGGAKAKKDAKKSTPKLVVPVWKNYVYVEFSFSAPEVKEGIVIALDYTNFAEGAPMQKVGDKYFQTIALGCGKTFKYKVRLLSLHFPRSTFFLGFFNCFRLYMTILTLADAHSWSFSFFRNPLPKRLLTSFCILLHANWALPLVHRGLCLRVVLLIATSPRSGRSSVPFLANRQLINDVVRR